MFNSIDTDFKSWADWMYHPEVGGRNVGYEKHSLLQDFTWCYPQYRPTLTMHNFKKLLMGYCKHSGLMFNPHRVGEKEKRDKSNGREYFFVCDERFEAGRLERTSMQKRKKQKL